MATNIDEEEYYSNNSEECKGFSIENENNKIRNEMLNDNTQSTIGDDKSIYDVFKFQYETHNGSMNMNITKTKDNKTNDPLTRIMKLKNELQTVSVEIKEYIEMNNDNLLLKETENFEQVIKDLDEYKHKLESFLNSPAYINNNKDSSSDIKLQIQHNLNKYTEISNKLLQHISKQKDLFKQGDNISYELIPQLNKDDIYNESNYDYTQINNKLKQLEDQIGEWNILKHNNTIIDEVKQMVTFCESKLQMTQDERMKIVDEIRNKMNEFIKEKESAIEITEYFIKVKELYNMLEMNDSFENVIEYLKQRLKAIKVIHEDSDKYSQNVSKLKSQLDINEGKMKELGKCYEETMNAFGEIEKIYQEIQSIDSKLNKYLI